jgi:hypothetical protein
MSTRQPINLGDRVRDRITGFEGIVIGITEWLYQCRRPIVQPTKLTTEGKQIESQSFDEDQLEVVEAGVFAPQVQRLEEAPVQATVRPPTGGPRETPARQSAPERRS